MPESRMFFRLRIYVFCMTVTCYGHIQYYWRFAQPKRSVFTARYETESLNVIHVSRNL